MEGEDAPLLSTAGTSPTPSDGRDAVLVSLGSFGVGVVAGLSGLSVVYGLLGGKGRLAFVAGGLYGLSLSVFHMGEFLVTAAVRPSDLDYEAMLLNHSVEYTVAHLVALSEFVLEVVFFPTVKQHPYVILGGLVFTLGATLLRFWALRATGQSFSQLVRQERRPGQELVTTGPYRYVRHPAYTAFLLWTIGTQMTACNPVSCIGLTAVAWGGGRTHAPP